jgi:hypothetical protein
MVGAVVAAVRFRSGVVTVELPGDITARMMARVRAAANGMVAVLESALEPVAANARQEWYGPRGVRERTGRSGDVVVTTTIDVTRASATVAIGTTDTSMSGRKARVFYIHTPGVLASHWKSVSEARYWQTPESLRGPFRRPETWRDDPGAPLTFPVVKVSPDNAGKGHGYLFVALIRTPARRAVKAVTAKLAKAATGGSGGK